MFIFDKLKIYRMTGVVIWLEYEPFETIKDKNIVFSVNVLEKVVEMMLLLNYCSINVRGLGPVPESR